jgi:glutamyl-tRNA(Gln) amidotransferase subunit E
VTELDYEELGFMCGIEIHQQLDTDTKLFCDCPVDLEDENPDSEVRRRLRSVAGETGAEDRAAEVEAEKQKEFVYKVHDRNNCLVELDEEPPHQMNPKALDTALTFARMVDAEIPPEIQVMRKMVVDGSNTSGFQRTAMIGLDGTLETETGEVSIEDIELEEESAGINERNGDRAVYDLSRLGVPLVEVGTDASIQSPEHAREVAERIGMLLRSTGKARRGLGTIRQDVNVSISEGSRVEIKGFQDIENIDRLIELEVRRQRNLVQLGEELGDREVVADNVTHLFEETENEIVSTVIENNGSVYGFRLPELAGRMKEEISGDRYVAQELVDYARSRGINGIIHTDEDQDYGLEEGFEAMAQDFSREEGDALAILAGPKAEAKQAAKAVRDRAQMLYTGEVPEETRTAEQDHTTAYSRPLPGSARMYPETDVPPVEITDEKVNGIDENLPDTIEERRQRYADEVGEELARQITSSRRLGKFEELRDETDSKTAANVLVNTLPKLESDGYTLEEVKTEDIQEILQAVDREEIARGDIEETLKAVTEGKNPGEALEEIKESRSSREEIREAVSEVLSENEEMIQEQGEHAQGALMGACMEKVDADGGTVSEILSEELQKHI